MKKIKDYLAVGTMLLITLNPFSSYAYSTRYSIREPSIIQQENFDYLQGIENITRIIPLPPVRIPARIFHPTRTPLPLAPKESLEKKIKVREVRIEFPKP